MRRLLLLGCALAFSTTPAFAELYELPIGGGPSSVTPAVPGVAPGSFYRGIAPDGQGTGKGTNPVYDAAVPGIVSCGQSAVQAMKGLNSLQPPPVKVDSNPMQPMGIINDVATDIAHGTQNCLNANIGPVEPGVPEAPFN